jgi:hypothetical protein
MLSLLVETIMLLLKYKNLLHVSKPFRLSLWKFRYQNLKHKSLIVTLHWNPNFLIHVFRDCEGKHIWHCYELLHAAIECGDFQTTVLTYRIAYKNKNLRNIISKISFNYSFYFLKAASPEWSFWHAINSCNFDRHLTINLEQ